MYKLIKHTHRILTGKKANETISDRILSKTRKHLFSLIFALAITNKVTPKKLANAFKGDKIRDFAKKFSTELDKEDEKGCKS